MAKPQIVSPDDDLVAPLPDVAANDELQSELDAQRALNEEPNAPTQPYVAVSASFKNDMQKRKVMLDADIGILTGQRDGMNARIDDMHATRVAVQAALDVLK